MSASSRWPSSSENPYLLCLVAHQMGLLSRERLDECLRALERMEPGRETVDSLVEAGLLGAEEAARAKDRLTGMAGPGVSLEGGEPRGERTQPSPGFPPSRPAMEMLGGEFELLGVIGRGAMGTVYRAREVVLGREVALKVLDPAATDDPERLERFRKEAHAAARIEHHGIARIHGLGSSEGRHYISMELVDGVSLAALIPEAGMEPRRALEIARDVARALQAAHVQGVLHRDVKPGNVLVERGPDGREGGGCARLLDFGIASLDDGGTRITRQGELLGTPVYLSPEQALGQKVDARADVFSLGATLYHLLLGRPPHSGTPSALLFHKVAREEPAPLGVLRPGLSPDAAAIVARAMCWEPEGRYATAGELAGDVERFLRGEATLARPVTHLDRVRRWLRRRRVLVRRVAVVLLVLCLAGAAALAWKDYRDSRSTVTLAAESNMAGDPLSAIAAVRDLAAGSIWKEIERAARSQVVIALEKLGSYQDVGRLFEGGAGVLDQIIPRDTAELSRKLIREHQVAPVKVHLQKTAMELRGTRSGFQAGRDLAALERQTGDIRGARARLESLRISPHAGEAEKDELEEEIRILDALGAPGDPVYLGPLFCHTLGDLDGDGKPELVAVCSAESPGGAADAALLEIRSWKLEGPRPVAAGSHRVVPHPGKLPVAPQAVSLAVTDVNGTPRRFIVLYCVRFLPETDGFLVIFRLDAGGIERVAVIQEGLGGHRASTLEGLKIDQLTGSDSPDLVLGLASGGSKGRRTVVIEDPFVTVMTKALPKIHELPAWNESEKGLNDTSAVFTGDFDGDGKPEVGYATTAWRGYDFRVYRRAAGGRPFELLCPPVKVGSIGAAVATDLDGDGICEVAVARHSYLSHNTRATSEWPEIGNLSEGVYVYRFTRSAGGAGFERIYEDPLEDKIVDPPEFLRCEHLSPGRVAGRSALLASWFRWTEGRRLSFLDLYVLEKARGDQTPTKGGLPLRRHRIFWSDQDAQVVGYLADLNGDGDSEVVTLTARLEPAGGDPSGTGAWQWRLATWRPEVVAFDGNSIAADAVDPLVSALQSRIRLGRYREALGLIKNSPQNAKKSSPTVNLLWVRAAGRARDWGEVDRAVEALGGAGGLEGRDRRESEMWKQAAHDGHALSKLMAIKEDFHSNPTPRWELSKGQAEWLEREGAVSISPDPPEFSQRGAARYLSRPCPTPVNGDRGFFLGIDLCIEKLGWNRILEIGLARVSAAADSSPSEFYGFRISQGGGMGAGWRWADLAWKGASPGSPDLRFVLKEGSCYRFEVEHSPSERRVRMLVREIGGAAGDEKTEFHRAWPPDEVTSWEDSAIQKAQPVAPGEYELGVFSGVVEGAGEGKEPVRIRVHSIELRVAAAP